MNSGAISRRYATALFKYACRHKKERSIYDTAVTLSGSYVRFPALRRTLDNPILPAEQKEELIILASGQDVSNEFLNFIRLVIKQKREESLQMICLSYQDIYRKEKKLLHVDIITAVPIDKQIEKEVANRIERMTNETVDVATAVDREIIGGYILKWDTYRWDASVVSQLKQIKEELKNRVKIG